MAATTQGRRLDVLARPKPIPSGMIEDRRSVYWVDKVPPQPKGGTTVFVLTPRQDQLAQTKNVNSNFKGDLLTPIWRVNKAAMSTEASPRVQALAEHKTVHREHKMERSVYTRVTPGARGGEASERLDAMAKPKRCGTYGQITDGDHFFQLWQLPIPVPGPAKYASCTPRVEALAEAKDFNPQYHGARTIQWPVTDPAKKALATLRVQQLARPKSRGGNDDYDPYRVSGAAKLARATPRVLELCEPIPRKIRQKKVFVKE
ncbi:unnamed protein product [Owenia fusiformis]|uniref:Testicular haploid expressed protein n=1 Tax=Owenia fusiformis TaxID=6347 RepID=A0A8S4N1Y4_OWEFU|nr:unnamed protein product [Owenia fusiformis]